MRTYVRKVEEAIASGDHAAAAALRDARTIGHGAAQKESCIPTRLAKKSRD